MAIQTKTFDYVHDDTILEAYMAWDDELVLPRPAVLICHDAMGGKSHFEHERARSLAKAGYVGFALDVYGKDVRADSAEKAYQLMDPFSKDVEFLRCRLLAAVDAAAEQAEVDRAAIAAIGYCFGGKCALELARSGADIKAVASFHGLLTAALPAAPNAVKARILVLHGWSDPLVPAEQVLEFAQEMTSANADWQLVAYGNAMHSFTNPQARDPANGIAYQEEAERRSWLKLLNFLTEAFG